MVTSKVKGSILALALALALVPGTAFAAEGAAEEALISSSGSMLVALSDRAEVPDAAEVARERADRLSGMYDQLHRAVVEKVEKSNYTIPYDRSHIDRIGNQAASGHTICCPSYACAYADAVMDGTVNDHSYYSCYSCRWPNWGGGNSSFRNAGYGTPQLREAYDQISQGRPVVIHVSGVSGEHWIALIGYANATDPDNLSLSNFTALDPWDGAQINAGSKYSLYGDGCQHISSR